MKRLFLIGTLFCTALLAEARIWTDIEGKTFEAEIVQINSNKTVKLKTVQKKTITTPFSSLIPDDVTYLETLLAQESAEKLHPVPWNEMNTLFGLEIWQDDCLWDDSTESAAKRMKLIKESKTAFIENHRAYPLGKEKILQEPVYATVLYGGRENVESLLFVFFNQGDGIPMVKITGETAPAEVVNEITKKIKDSGAHLHDTLVRVLGEPERDTIGRNALRENVCRWDWNGHAILLVMLKGKYTMMRILPAEQGCRVGKVEKINRIELKKKMASCVERCENGDVLVNSIPMIDQGPKGYCVPATYERYCRYLGIPVDMYLLANLAKSQVGGGTSGYDAGQAVKSILSNYGPRLEGIGFPKETKNIAKYIDQGIPILWCLSVTSEFERAADENTDRQNGEELDQDKKDTLIRAIKRELELAEKNQIMNGHMRLIIGYNEKSQEIAFSDSWGPAYSVRWIPLDIAKECTLTQMEIIQ